MPTCDNACVLAQMGVLLASSPASSTDLQVTAAEPAATADAPLRQQQAHGGQDVAVDLLRASSSQREPHCARLAIYLLVGGCLLLIKRHCKQSRWGEEVSKQIVLN